MGAASRTEVIIMSRNGEKSRGDLYARITDRIIAELERGVRGRREYVGPHHPTTAAQRPALYGHQRGVALGGSRTAARWRFTPPRPITFRCRRSKVFATRTPMSPSEPMRPCIGPLPLTALKSRSQ